MSNTPFLFPMSKREKILGWIYVPIHGILLSFFIGDMAAFIFPRVGIPFEGAYLNIFYYAIGFVFVLAAMFRYLRASFSDLCDNIWGSLRTVILSYVLYYVMSIAMTGILYEFLEEISNPNSELIISETRVNAGAMKVSVILLAPIVEEVLFRGVVFGTIRNKSRILAYVVSTVLFSAYHLWDFFFYGFDWTLFLYMLQYIPGSIALAFCYERSRNIWAPIVLHMAINFISLNVSIG